MTLSLIIEHQSCTKPGLSEMGPAPTVCDGKVTLQLSLHKQQQSDWCWAAIAEAIATYYETGNLTQSEVASGLLGFDCTDFENDAEVAEKSNQQLYLEDALKLVQSFSHWVPTKPAFERIQNEINCGRPICLRIEWYRGGAHYLMVTGYDLKSKTLLLQDSKYGNQEINYDDFPAKYQEGGAAWTETYWTRP